MANFQCPAQAICSEPMTTKVGVGKIDPKKPTGGILGPMPSQGTPVEHITVMHLDQGADDKVDGGWTFVHEKQNGEWNTVAVSTDGGENWAFREDEDLGNRVKSFTTDDVKQSLNEQDGVLRKNVDQQSVSALTKAGISEPEIKNVVPSTKNQAPTNAPTTTDPNEGRTDMTWRTSLDEDLGTQDSAQISETNPGTRKDFGKDLTYPSTLDLKSQDTICYGYKIL